jgi:hypothetical protein
VTRATFMAKFSIALAATVRAAKSGGVVDVPEPVVASPHVASGGGGGGGATESKGADVGVVLAAVSSGPEGPVASAEFELEASSAASGKPVANLISGSAGSFWQSNQSGRATHRISVRFRGGAAANRLELGVAGSPSSDGSYSPAVIRVTGKLRGGGVFEATVQIPSTPSTDVVQWVALRDGRVPFTECVLLSQNTERKGCDIRLYGLRASRSAAPSVEVEEDGAPVAADIVGLPPAAASLIGNDSSGSPLAPHVLAASAVVRSLVLLRFSRSDMAALASAGVATALAPLLLGPDYDCDSSDGAATDAILAQLDRTSDNARGNALRILDARCNSAGSLERVCYGSAVALLRGLLLQDSGLESSIAPLRVLLRRVLKATLGNLVALVPPDDVASGAAVVASPAVAGALPVCVMLPSTTPALLAALTEGTGAWLSGPVCFDGGFSNGAEKSVGTGAVVGVKVFVPRPDQASFLSGAAKRKM